MDDSKGSTGDTTHKTHPSDAGSFPQTDSGNTNTNAPPDTSSQEPGAVPVLATLPITDAKLDPADTSQKTAIQLQDNSPTYPDYLEAKVVIPVILAIVGWCIAIFLYFRGRQNKINDDLNSIVTRDVQEFLEKIESLTRLVALHQSGCPCHGEDLKESRKHLTSLRQTAMAVSNRIDKALLYAVDRNEWKTNFRKWKTATEGNTDWITNKTNKWSQEKMDLLEKANEVYTGKVTNFRNRIATRKIKLMA